MMVEKCTYICLRDQKLAEERLWGMENHWSEGHYHRLNNP